MEQLQENLEEYDQIQELTSNWNARSYVFVLPLYIGECILSFHDTDNEDTHLQGSVYSQDTSLCEESHSLNEVDETEGHDQHPETGSMETQVSHTHSLSHGGDGRAYSSHLSVPLKHQSQWKRARREPLVSHGGQTEPKFEEQWSEQSTGEFNIPTIHIEDIESEHFEEDHKIERPDTIEEQESTLL